MKTSEKNKRKNYNSKFSKIKISVHIKDQLLQHKYQHKKIFNHKMSVKKQHFKTGTQIHSLKIKII